MNLIFADTNVLIPQSTRELYKTQLAKTDPKGKPIHNSHVSKTSLEQAISDIEQIKTQLDQELISTDSDNILVTEGIQKQVSPIFQQIRGNIEQRTNIHLFTQFSRLTTDAIKFNDEKGYSRIKDYDLLISSLETMTQMYPLPTNTSYFLLNEFLRSVKDDFFDLTKEKHTYDFGADLQLATSAIYESCVNGNKIKVFSNDNDVINMISATYAILNRARNIMRGTKYFNHLNNPDLKPELNKLSERGIEIIDTLTKGDELIVTFPGYDGTLDDNRKSEYQTITGKFGTFLRNSLYRLREIK